MRQDTICALIHLWRMKPKFTVTFVMKEATETAEGVKTYSCKVCGKTRIEVIPKKVSTESNTENVEPEKGVSSKVKIKK